MSIRKNQYIMLVLSTFIFLFIAGCRVEDSTQEIYTYQIPEKMNDGWEKASLKSVGIDSRNLVNLVNIFHSQENHRVHGILIARQGRIVFEEYFDGYRRDDQKKLIHFTRDVLHDLASVTKSFTSALLGIAINHGFISGIDKLRSRSQAKRLMNRMECFKEILLDFTGIDTIGSSFADEIFRVFQEKYPEITLKPINENKTVNKIINQIKLN